MEGQSTVGFILKQKWLYGFKVAVERFPELWDGQTR